MAVNIYWEGPPLKNILGGPTPKKYTGRAHPYIFYPTQNPGPGRGPGACSLIKKAPFGGLGPY